MVKNQSSLQLCNEGIYCIMEQNGTPWKLKGDR